MKNRTPMEEMRYSYSLPKNTTFGEALEIDGTYLAENPQIVLVFRPMIESETIEKPIGKGERYVFLASICDKEFTDRISFTRMMGLSLKDAMTIRDDYFNRYCKPAKRNFIVLEQSIILW